MLPAENKVNRISGIVREQSWTDRGVARATDILVVHVAEQLDLAERALGVDLVVEGVGDLLDGHLLPRLGVERRAGH